MTAKRNPMTDPRVGDVVQVIPALSAELPAPLTITHIDHGRVYWVREGYEASTALANWKGSKVSGNRRMELICEATEGQA